jgi:excinuclease ABC subunit A
VRRLVAVLGRLADAGHSLVVIEHHLDVIKCADWIVDLGPEGGDRGGTLVAEGTPEEVAATKGSFTGAYLAPMLARSGRKPVRKTGEPGTTPGKKPALMPAPKPSKPAKPAAKKAPARTKAAR